MMGKKGKKMDYDGDYDKSMKMDYSKDKGMNYESSSDHDKAMVNKNRQGGYAKGSASKRYPK